MRLYEAEQMLGTPQAAIAHLRAALRVSRIVALPAQAGAAIGVLAVSRVASWEANVPLELVIDETRFAVHRLYLDDGDDERVLEQPLPAFQLVFNTIAESDAARPALALAARLIEQLGVPALNAPVAVAELGRDAVAARFAASPAIVAPPVERVPAAALQRRDLDGPSLVRPVGSQAGVALARVDDTAALQAYLRDRADASYFLTPFVDYRSADGFFRKYRVIFVDGVPYPYHLAISPRWMIHYYNADMAENAWMRDEEARFVAAASPFDGAADAALAEIAAAIPLEYFGIDCALLPNGQLLLFEADAAMLVHGTDPPDLYPYKRAAFARVQSALTAALNAKLS